MKTDMRNFSKNFYGKITLIASMSLFILASCETAHEAKMMYSNDPKKDMSVEFVIENDAGKKPETVFLDALIDDGEKNKTSPDKDSANNAKQPVYSKIQEKIGDGFNHYMNEYVNKNIEIIDCGVVFEFSTEGGTITLFKDKNDELLRVKCNFLGETGRSEINMYYFENSPSYCTILASHYSCHIMERQRNDIPPPTDILYHKFYEYWFEDDLSFQINNIDETLIECESPLSGELLEAVDEFKNGTRTPFFYPEPLINSQSLTSSTAGIYSAPAEDEAAFRYIPAKQTNEDIFSEYELQDRDKTMPLPMGNYEGGMFASWIPYYDSFYPLEYCLHKLLYEYSDMIDEKDLEKWNELYKLPNDAANKLTEQQNIYTFLLYFDIPENEFKNCLKNNRHIYEDAGHGVYEYIITDEQIDILWSKDEKKIIDAFADKATIVKGLKFYSPSWIYNHSAQAYKAENITPGELISQLFNYYEIGLTREAYEALKKKTYDYADSYPNFKYKPEKEHDIYISLKDGITLENTKNNGQNELYKKDNSMPFPIDNAEIEESFLWNPYNHSFYPLELYFSKLVYEYRSVIDETDLEKWGYLFLRHSSDVTRLTDQLNIYTFILYFDIPEDEFKTFLKNNRRIYDNRGYVVHEYNITDEEIDILWSKDEKKITETFADNVTIVKGEKFYSPCWVYYNTAQAYKAENITPDELISQLEGSRSKFNFTNDAFEAWEKKIKDYAETYAK
ncbi:MAG: hypothetical protein LBS21_07405 [Clostridiales bacterium]|jgi:hypothetical protein|nr:hypothetical protein [Clostridiales bacterium]